MYANPLLYFKIEMLISLIPEHYTKTASLCLESKTTITQKRSPQSPIRLLGCSLRVLVVAHETLEFEFLRVRCLTVGSSGNDSMAVRSGTLFVLLERYCWLDVGRIQMGEHEHDC